MTPAASSAVSSQAVNLRKESVMVSQMERIVQLLFEFAPTVGIIDDSVKVTGSTDG